MIETNNFQKVEVSSSQELREWLMSNHLSRESVWLVTYKKSVPDKYISTSEVLDELLCFGWIDGIRRKLNDHQSMQLISPRKTDHWSKTYKDRAEKLIKEKRMHKTGLDSIEQSKKNGLWNFMDDVDQLMIPQDLQEELNKYENASSFFLSINDSSKRFVLRYIKLAKTEKTRIKRIQHIAVLSSKNEKLKGS